MTHTEQQILEIAKTVLQGLRGERYKESDIENAYFNEAKEMARDINKGKPHPSWTVAIKAPFDNVDFLTISDRTGEPLYYQNFNMVVYEIVRDNKGNYHRKDN
ncbi:MULTISPECIES: hypothetical protein [unclassified Flavobacterium]|uniref:hypothetical protein n=1 Tax=unclassified Flavobacterium TaxID=196869 RepID=UPI001F131167|nr:MULTISPECIES: hypothetical protein [unclassified Flavobacterium]UMY66458.1 hypothetical protein MKO97_03495 [Flavobacterium sp. HJ-32-4]